MGNNETEKIKQETEETAPTVQQDAEVGVEAMPKKEKQPAKKAAPKKQPTKTVNAKASAQKASAKKRATKAPKKDAAGADESREHTQPKTSQSMMEESDARVAPTPQTEDVVLTEEAKTRDTQPVTAEPKKKSTRTKNAKTADAFSKQETVEQITQEKMPMESESVLEPATEALADSFEFEVEVSPEDVKLPLLDLENTEEETEQWQKESVQTEEPLQETTLEDKAETAKKPFSWNFFSKLNKIVQQHPVNSAADIAETSVPEVVEESADSTNEIELEESKAIEKTAVIEQQEETESEEASVSSPLKEELAPEDMANAAEEKADISENDDPADHADHADNTVKEMVSEPSESDDTQEAALPEALDDLQEAALPEALDDLQEAALPEALDDLQEAATEETTHAVLKPKGWSFFFKKKPQEKPAAAESLEISAEPVQEITTETTENEAEIVEDESKLVVDTQSIEISPSEEQEIETIAKDAIEAPEEKSEEEPEEESEETSKEKSEEEPEEESEETSKEKSEEKPEEESEEEPEEESEETSKEESEEKSEKEPEEEPEEEPTSLQEELEISEDVAAESQHKPDEVEEETQNEDEVRVAEQEQENEIVKKRFSFFQFFVSAAALFCFMAALFVLFLFLMSGSALLRPKDEVELPNFYGKTIQEVQLDVGYSKFSIDYVDIYTEEVPVGVIVDQTPKPPKDVKENAHIVLRVSAGIHTIEIPDIVGMERFESKLLLRENDLSMMVKPEESETVPEGYVIRTEPLAGEIVDANTTVVAYVSKGEEEYNGAIVPSCTGLSSTKASQLLGSRGLSVGVIRKVDSDSPEGTVISQSPSSGTVRPRGSGVILTVSNGAATADGGDHAHNYVQTGSIEPGPVSLGFTTHTCTICGQYYYDNFRDPTG